MVCSTEPPRPSQNIDWRRVSLTRCGSRADWPINSGESNSSEPATRARVV
jgi:hypothetical protein